MLIDCFDLPFVYLFKLPAQENLLEYLERDFVISRPSLSCSQACQKVVTILLHVSVIVIKRVCSGSIQGVKVKS